MNIKAEGRLTSFIIVLTLSLATIVLFSSLVGELTTEYNLENIDNFQNYSRIYESNYNQTQDLIKSQSNANLINISNGTGGNFIQTWYQNSWIKATSDSISEAWQDSIWRKGANTIATIPKSLKFATQSLTTALNQLKFPSIFKTLIISLLGISIVFMIAKAYWERRL